VREQLAGANLPNDAVGVTTAVQGQVLLGPGNTVQSDQSRFSVDLTTLKSDDSRRDNYLRRSTLETSRFPSAEFVLREVRGLALPLLAGAEAEFQLVGDLTVHGVTSSVVWNATGAFTSDGVTGKAATSFPFSQFGMSAPRVFVVVSVEDNIRLELDFRLVRAG
jgi:polyisoprenoid-binding protein YceI